MKLAHLPIGNLAIDPDLVRSGHAKQFEHRLLASIDAIGLAEPLKAAPASVSKSQYLVVDGVMRLRALRILHERDGRFAAVPAYIVPFEQRYELRFQTDIYQDLLPSQLASLVEHLHATEGVSKSAIAEFMGVSSATLRNYTGLWRLVQRGGLFAAVVRLMDAGVLPASNPYAWLRLNRRGVRLVIEHYFAEGTTAEAWVERQVLTSRRGEANRITLNEVEMATAGAPDDCYREDLSLRLMKKGLGRRRASNRPQLNGAETVRHLRTVTEQSSDPVLKSAAQSLLTYFA